MSIPRFAYWLLAALCFPVGAAELQVKARRVALFKNGYACVQMQGTLPAGTQMQVRGLPKPVFGTLSWTAPESVHISRLQASMSGNAADHSDQKLAGFLSANVGREMVVTQHSGKVYRGVVVAPALPADMPKSSFEDMPPLVHQAVPESPILVLKLNEGGYVTLPMRSIESVAYADGVQAPAQAKAVPELTLELREPAAGESVQFHCLTYGLSWFPVYSLELGQSGQASISGSVIIINELPDLEQVQLELITGFPAIGEAVITSPMVRQVNMDGFLSALESGQDWNKKSRKKDAVPYGEFLVSANANAEDYIMQMDVGDTMGSGGYGSRSSYSSLYRARALAEAASLSLNSTQAEDLFYYSIPDFSCRRGETVERNLFTCSVPCRHVYTCEVPEQQAIARRLNNNEPLAEVWHAVRLSNTGSLPWSTGVVVCYEGGQLFSRGILDYAAPGQESLLRLSKTTEATVGCSEELLERQMSKRGKSRQIDVYRGLLTIRNGSSHAMDTELSKKVRGVPIEASDGGSISITPAYAGNAESLIVWKLHLEPGEEKTCSYTYTYEN